MKQNIAACAVILLATQVYGRVFTVDANNNPLPLAKDASIELDLSPLSSIASIVFSISKIIGSIVSTIWSLTGYKLTAISLIANIACWLFRSGFTAVISSIIVIGFCTLTGMCGMSYLEEQLFDVDEALEKAARNLEEGTTKYRTVN